MECRWNVDGMSILVRNRSIHRKEYDVTLLSFFISQQVTFDDHRLKIKGKTAMKALIALEDGTLFAGQSFTGHGEAVGEIVFNTSLSGYQEVLTDPSYTGQ
ncbi:MAG: hypothetical protein ACD_75C00527G0001, partial [uncultured bacterium]